MCCGATVQNDMVANPKDFDVPMTMCNFCCHILASRYRDSAAEGK